MKKLLVLLFVCLCLAGSAAAAPAAKPPARGAARVEGEALVTFHLPHGLVSYDVFQEQAMPELEAIARDVLKNACGGKAELVELYPYLSFKGDYGFAHIRSSALCTDDLIAHLDGDERVHAACPNWEISLASTPNDPDLKKQWALRRIEAVSSERDQPDAWSIATGSGAVLVGVMDTGIDFLHADLAANYRDEGGIFLSRGRQSLDHDGHGTHVAGIIGGVGNNGIGISGLNWRVAMKSLKIIEHEGVGEVKNIVAALEHLISYNETVGRVHAVNMSFSFASNIAPGGMRDSPVYQAFKHLDDQNKTVMVAASGNGGYELGDLAVDLPYEYPACFTLRNLVVVGATDRHDRLLGSARHSEGMSNWSPSMVHLLAPGEDIWSTEPSNRYANRTGTSMAAPFVTGTIALMASVNPDLSAATLKDLLLHAADSSINPPGIGADGGEVPGTRASVYGMLDVRRAVELAAEK